MDAAVIQEILQYPILHFNARNFDHFPEEFKFYGFDTREVYCRWNKISHLPAWIGCLKNLTNLYFSENKIKTLPYEIGELINLKVLYLDFNDIHSLPSSIKSLVKLKSININDNKLLYLPKEVGALTSLEELLASRNQLTSLPDELSACRALEELQLSSNLLRRVPRSLVYLPRLRTLELAYNLLLELPAVPFTSLPLVSIPHNPQLTYISHHALQQSFNPQYTCVSNQRCKYWSTNNCTPVQLKTFCCNEETILHMPQDLLQVVDIFTVQRTPFSLRELSMRKVSTAFYGPGQAQVENVWGLPASIHCLLRQGPVSLCATCNGPIFTAAQALLTHTGIINIPHCISFYCSDLCTASSAILLT